MNTIYIRLSFKLQITSPDNKICTKDGEPPEEYRRQAIETATIEANSAMSLIPQLCKIYINEDNDESTDIFIDCSEADVQDVWTE